MKTIRRTLFILFISLLIGVGLWVLSGTAWAGGYADGVVAANQAMMDAAYTTQTTAGGHYVASGANMLKILAVTALVIGATYLLETRR